MCNPNVHVSPKVQIAFLLSFACCVTLAQDRATVSADLASRTGHGLKPAAPSRDPGAPSFPPGLSFTGKVTEDEAVAIALWNSAALEATLAGLGLARADLVEAGLLRNPSLQVLLPVGPKPFEFALQWPVEVLWQRPRRVAAANLNLKQVSVALVQNGLDLARDVRVAHAELELAERKAAIARESADLRVRIAGLTDLRLKNGDISELEAALVRAEARSYDEQAVRMARDVDAAGERLRLLMGLRRDKSRLAAVSAPAEEATVPEWEMLVETAMSTRPDLRAAEIAIQAAAQRARWERSRILSLVAPILSIKEVGTSGVRTGPGAAVDIPVFQRNQGGISRADAEVERATLAYLALLERIELEVREARLQLLQARESAALTRDEVLPGALATVRLAEKAHANGDAPYLFVLEAGRQVFDVRSREAEALAAARRARAQLERSVGRKL